jgi:hypothetical protein
MYYAAFWYFSCLRSKWIIKKAMKNVVKRVVRILAIKDQGRKDPREKDPGKKIVSKSSTTPGLGHSLHAFGSIWL